MTGAKGTWRLKTRDNKSLFILMSYATDLHVARSSRTTSSTRMPAAVGVHRAVWCPEQVNAVNSLLGR